MSSIRSRKQREFGRNTDRLDRNSPYARPLKGATISSDRNGAMVASKGMRLYNQLGARKARQTKGLGLLQPDPPQAAIVITCFALKNEIDRRKACLHPLNTKESDLLAPLGAPEDFRIMQGSLVYAIKTADSKGKFYTPPAKVGSQAIQESQGPGKRPDMVSDINVFDCVNGLKRGTSLMFVGWQAIDANVDDENTMNITTVMVVGTCTAINTGRFTIHAFAGVYFDEEPYALLERGKLVPGISEVGMSPSKFRVAILSLHDNDIASMTTKAYRQMEEALPEIWKKYNTESKLENLMTECDELISIIMGERPKTFPLSKLLYIHLFTLFGLWRNDIFTTTDINQKIVEKVVKSMRDDRDRYNRSIGESSSTQEGLFALYDDAPPEEAQEYQDYMTQLLYLRDWHMITLRSWIQSHYIGIAQNTSEPGGPVKINLRYGCP